MIWIFRVLNVLFMIGSVFAFVKGNVNLLYTFTSLLGFAFFLSGIYKGYTVGLDSVRGKFWVLLSLIGLVVGIGILLNNNLIIHILGRFFLVIALMFMFVGLARRGLVLRGKRLVIFLIVFVITIVSAIYIYTNYPTDNLLKSFFLLMDVLVASFTVANLSVYIGSDLGNRWLLGLVSMLCYALGDVMFYAGSKVLYLLVWSLALFLIAIVSQIED